MQSEIPKISPTNFPNLSAQKKVNKTLLKLIRNRNHRTYMYTVQKHKPKAFFCLVRFSISFLYFWVCKSLLLTATNVHLITITCTALKIRDILRLFLNCEFIFLFSRVSIYTEKLNRFGVSSKDSRMYSILSHLLLLIFWIYARRHKIHFFFATADAVSRCLFDEAQKNGWEVGI